MGDQGNLKIYFCGSVQGGRQDGELYARIIDRLKHYGQVLTEVLGKENVIEIERTLTPEFIFQQDIKWLDEANVIIAEVTQPSLGVGVELGRAQILGKRVLCLFRPARGNTLSCMVRGAQGERFTVRDYEESDLTEIFQTFFGY